MGTPTSATFGTAPAAIFGQATPAYVLQLDVPDELQTSLPQTSGTPFGLFDGLSSSLDVGFDLTAYAKLTFNPGDAKVVAIDAHADATLLGQQIVSWTVPGPAGASADLEPKNLGYVNALNVSASKDFGSNVTLYQGSVGQNPSWNVDLTFLNAGVAQLVAQASLQATIKVQGSLQGDMNLKLVWDGSELTLDPQSVFHLHATANAQITVTAGTVVQVKSFIGDADLADLILKGTGVLNLNGDLYVYPGTTGGVADLLNGTNLTLQAGYNLSYNLSALPEPFTLNSKGDTGLQESDPITLFNIGQGGSGNTGPTNVEIPVVGTPTVTATADSTVYTGSPQAYPTSDVTVSGPNGLTSSGGALSFTYDGSSTVPTTAGTYSLAVTFTPNDTADDTTGSTTTTWTIEPATPVITWANPAAIAVFTPLYINQLDATANVPGTFVYTPPAGTLLSAGTHTLSVVFTPADGADYTTATATVPLVVLAPGVTVIGTQLYLVGGDKSNDQIQVNPTGSSNTGSTGVKVNASLNGVNTQATYNQAFTAVDIFLQGGDNNVDPPSSLTISMIVTAGNGNDNIQLGNGNNAVMLGNGNDNVQLGNGNNIVTLGDGNNNVLAGNGNNTVVVGGGNDNVLLGNGNNVITLGSGTGHNNVVAGNGTNTVTGTNANGNNNVLLGNGSGDSVTLGNGNNNVLIGSGSYETVLVGDGNNNVLIGNGSYDDVTIGTGSTTS